MNAPEPALSSAEAMDDSSMGLEEVIELALRYGSAGLTIPGFRAVQLCQEILRLRESLQIDESLI